MKSLYTLMFSLFFIICAKAQITVTTINVGLELAQKLVGNGVTISNVTFSAANGTCGTFTNINSVIKFDSGIVMTSGFAKTLGTTTTGVDGLASRLASTDYGGAGDFNLNTLVTPNTTEDAAILEFDFVPLGDTISFNYQFTSEEYPEFVCQTFNDVFAFFLSGPGVGINKNIALIPGTNVPVTINNINDQTCGLLYNPFYVPNYSGTKLTHDGLTVKLKAFSAVTPCLTYHLKIAIADVGDGLYDSGVFIEANSLNSNAVNTAVNGDIDPVTNTFYLAEGCNSGDITFTKPIASSVTTITTLTIEGTATNGVDATLIPNIITFAPNQTTVVIPITAFSDGLVEGTETLKIYINSVCGADVYLDSASIEIRDYKKLFIVPDSTSVCPGSSKQLVASTGYDTYTWLPNPTLSSTTIYNPFATPLVSPTRYYCEAEVGTCRAKDSAVLYFNDLKLKTKSDIFCKNAATGSISVGAGSGWALPLQFTINNGTPQADSTFNNLAVGIYTIGVTDALGCSKTLTVSLVQAYPDLDFTQIVQAPVCLSSGSITVNGVGGLAPYTYSLTGTTYQASNVLINNAFGNVTVYIKDANNCVYTKIVNVVNPPSLSITYVITPATCSGAADGKITIATIGGSAPFQYSSDAGATFQASNVLLVTNGSKSILVKDVNGCIGVADVDVPLNNNLIVDAGNNITFCESKTDTLKATSNATTYLWTPNTAIYNNAVLQPLVNPITTTQYYLTATTGICNAIDSVLVNVIPAPIAYAGIDTGICYNDIIQLQGSGGNTYLWQPNVAITGITTPNPTVKPLVTTRYWLSVTSSFGCKSLVADTVLVTVIPIIKPFAGNDTIVALNQPLQLNAIANAPNYIWTPSTYLSNATINNPIANIPIYGDHYYTVKAYTNEGCFGTDNIKITIFKGPTIYVPTAFTPNSDGTNDVLKITAVGLKQFVYFRIYNRWGQLIFDANNAAKGWDGTFNNTQQPTGTYVWNVKGVDYTGKTINLKGTLILLR